MGERTFSRKVLGIIDQLFGHNGGDEKLHRGPVFVSAPTRNNPKAVSWEVSLVCIKSRVIRQFSFLTLLTKIVFVNTCESHYDS